MIRERLAALAADERVRRVVPLAVALLVYLPNLDDFYLSDDLDHPYLDGYPLDRLIAHLSGPADPGEFFRPVTRLSMALDHALFGRIPELSHVVNVLLHGATAMLVAALARRLTGRSLVAVLAGVLFAAHPIHPEAVSFLGGRFDVLAALFGTASVLAHVIWAERGAPRWAVASVALFVLSIGSKEAGGFVPLAIAAYELTCAPRRRLLRAAPTAVALVLYGVYRVTVIGSVGGYAGAQGGTRHLPSLDLAYFTEFFRFTGYGLVTPVNHAAVGAAALALLVALAALFAVFVAYAARPPREHVRPMLFALGFALLGALPASTLFGSAGLAERFEGARFLYFASVGYCLLLATMIARVRPSDARRWLAAAQVALYAGLTVAHALPWSHASRLARGSVATILDRCRDLPGPAPTVLVFGAPDNVDGAFLWRNGLGAAIRKMHPQRPVGSFMRAELEPDFFEPEGFDLRDHAGRRDVCMLRWDPDAEALEDVSAALRAATPPPTDGPIPRGEGERWWDGWALFNAEAERDDGPAWVFVADNDDPHFVAPSAPLSVREIVLEMAVEPLGGEDATLGEVYWAVDDEPFDPAVHHRLFGVIADGAPHEYRLRVPLTDPEELEARSLRVRVDPALVPARVTVHRAELSAAPPR